VAETRRPTSARLGKAVDITKLVPIIGLTMQKTVSEIEKDPNKWIDDMVCPDMLSACQMRYLSVTTNALKLTSIFAHAAMLIFGGNECNVNQYTSRYWPNSFI